MPLTHFNDIFNKVVHRIFTILDGVESANLGWLITCSILASSFNDSLL
jgi:hypothetical protein